MSKDNISTTLEGARCLGVTKQHLAGKLPKKATHEQILSVVRDLVYVQWDPIAVVAPSHVLSLWNRVGSFRLSDLDRLMWDEKKLFEHWPGRFAAIVLTEDYPMYYSMMKRYPETLGRGWGAQRASAIKFLAEHKELAKSMLNELKKKGPLQLNQFQDYTRTKRTAEAWTPGSDVSAILFHLEMMGKIMVVGHQGIKNIWGLSEDFLPSWVEKREFSEEETEYLTAQRAIRALGTASDREIDYYFPRGCYQNLKRALESLLEDETIHRIEVAGLADKHKRYVHHLDLKLLEKVSTDQWQPRMSLLPPFDNLVNGRHTSRVFGFDYVHEMFLPQNKRRFGYYVLSILWGENFIGRVDPLLDRREEKLVIHAVHAEPRAPSDKRVASMIKETLERLAESLGAKEVVYTDRVPTAWKNSLR